MTEPRQGVDWAISLRFASLAASGSAVLVGVLGLVGWWIGAPMLTSVWPGFVSMKANSALAIAVTGMSLWLVSDAQAGRWRRWVARVGAALVGLMGLLTLLQYVLGWNLGVDELMFWDPWWAPETSHPGRMAPNSALVFVLLGSALLLIDVRDRLAQTLSLLAGLVALLAGVGYLYGVQDLYGLPSYTSTAVPEVVAFLLLSGSVFFARPARAWAAIFASDSRGGFIARRLLPAVVIVPVGMGWLLLLGQRAGLHDTTVMLALFATFTIVLFTLIVGWNAGTLSQFDAQQKQASARLAAEHRVTRILAEARSFEVAAPAILQTICDSLGVQVGVLWLPDASGERLGCAEAVVCDGFTQAQPYMEASRRSWFAPGVSLPGRAWSTRRPVCIANLQAAANVPRADAAAQSGLRSGMAFPILIGDEFFGVMEFTATNSDEPDSNLLDMMAAIGSEIGQFIWHRRTQDAVRRSEARHRAILESALDCIITMDHEGRIIEFNPAAEETFGHRQENIVGQRLADVIIPPRLREGHARALVRMLQGEEGAVLGHRVEMPAIRADGSEFPAEFAITATELPGHPPFFTAYLRDITERVEAEAARAESEQRFRSTFENAAVGMAHTGQDGRLLLVNQRFCDILGYSADELLAKRFHDFTHPDDIEASTAYRRRLSEGQTDVPSIDKRYLRKDGSVVWCHLTLSAVHDHEPGRPRYFIAAIQDITERKRADVQLKQFNERLEQQVAERTQVAVQRTRQLRRLATELTRAEEQERRRLAQLLHDHLQQLLVAARLRIPMAEDGAKPGDSGEPGDESSQLFRQIDDLLCQAIEASRSLTLELSPPILYQGGLVAAVEWLARQMPEKHGLEVEVVSEGPVEVHAEDVRALLFQSVRELLFNVVKHAGVKRARVVLGRADDGRAWICVEDEGAGFDAASLAARLDQDEQDGFGLFSIEERLQSLGGSFDVESRPGHGTCVTLSVPADLLPAEAAAPEADELATAEALASKAAASVDSGPIRILLADDHKLMREGLAELLRKEPDMQVVGEAEDGFAAVKLTQQFRPDVVLMDMAMPRMGGVEATRRIMAEQQGVCVIGLSMHEPDDVADAMRDAGAVAYLSKGGPSDALIAAIRECRVPRV